jgi:hypothetical protein
MLSRPSAVRWVGLVLIIVAQVVASAPLIVSRAQHEPADTASVADRQSERATSVTATPDPRTPADTLSTKLPGVWAAADGTYVEVPLQEVSELASPETNLELPPGDHVMDGIPMETGWTASTQCSTLPARPQEFSLKVGIAVKSLYFLLQAGWGMQSYASKQMGSIELNFSDGSKSVPLILGSNIRDWSLAHPGAVTTVTDPNTSEAWEGLAPDGTWGRMDLLTVPLGQVRTLQSITVRDESNSKLGSTDPCVHLLAVSVAASGLGGVSAGTRPLPACEPADEKGPWPTPPGTPVKPLPFDIDSSAGLVMLDIWIPGESPANTEYEIWLRGRRLHFQGAGVAWLYGNCDPGVVYSQVADHEQQRKTAGITTVRISIHDFATLYPGSIATLDGGDL